MLFAIMLTRQITGEATRQLFERWPWAAVTAAGIFLLVIVPTILRPGLPAGTGGPGGSWPRTDPAATTAETAPGTEGAAPIAGAFEIGRSFMQEYLLPFEVASILLLVALIGAIVIAYE